jgi:hypothetical protein
MTSVAIKRLLACFSPGRRTHEAISFSSLSSASRPSWGRSMRNSEKPQSKQTTTCGNAQTDAFVRSFGLGKWMFISVGNAV